MGWASSRSTANSPEGESAGGPAVRAAVRRNPMMMSTAVVVTDASFRYAKQLLSHLGHKVTVEPLDDQPAPAGRLVFSYGTGTVVPQEGTLVLQASAADAESLA